MGKEVSNTAAGLYYIIVEKLKVNLHITEKCNFHCRYCFAHFNNKKDLLFEAWKEILAMNLQPCCNYKRAYLHIEIMPRNENLATDLILCQTGYASLGR